jgi:hypothetical protein
VERAATFLIEYLCLSYPGIKKLNFYHLIFVQSIIHYLQANSIKMTTSGEIAEQNDITEPDIDQTYVNQKRFKFKLEIIIIKQTCKFSDGINELVSKYEYHIIDLPKELEDDMMEENGYHLNIVNQCSGTHIRGSERAIQHITGSNGLELYQKLKEKYGLYHNDLSLRCDNYNSGLPYHICVGRFIKSCEIIRVDEENLVSVDGLKEHNKYS